VFKTKSFEAYETLIGVFQEKNSLALLSAWALQTD
jgi:hypothetical protein